MLKKFIPLKIKIFIKNIIELLIFPFYYFKFLKIKISENSKIQEKKIILKCDDLNGYSKNVKILNKIIIKYNIKVSWGIIGKYLISPKKSYIKFLVNLNSNYHIFNHGFYHNVGPNDYEFDGPTFDEQYNLIIKTNNLYNHITKKKLDTFGAPCNHIDDNTTIALSKIPEIKYWFYGKNNQYNINLKRSINIEKDIGCPDFNFLLTEIEKFESLDDVITLQCHPNAFKLRYFLQFVLIIKFFKKNNCSFIFPNELF